MVKKILTFENYENVLLLHMFIIGNPTGPIIIMVQIKWSIKYHDQNKITFCRYHRKIFCCGCTVWQLPYVENGLQALIKAGFCQT